MRCVRLGHGIDSASEDCVACYALPASSTANGAQTPQTQTQETATLVRTVLKSGLFAFDFAALAHTLADRRPYGQDRKTEDLVGMQDTSASDMAEQNADTAK